MARGDRVKRAGPLAATTPNPLDEWRIGLSFVEVNQQAGLLYLHLRLRAVVFLRQCVLVSCFTSRSYDDLATEADPRAPNLD